MQEDSLLSTPSLAFIVCGFFDDSYFGLCEVISHYSFDFHFSDSDVELFDRLYVFLGEISTLFLIFLIIAILTGVR